jgi:hypothetical protein
LTFWTYKANYFHAKCFWVKRVVVCCEFGNFCQKVLWALDLQKLLFPFIFRGQGPKEPFGKNYQTHNRQQLFSPRNILHENSLLCMSKRSKYLRTQISSESVNFIENSCLRLSSGYGCATLFWLAKNKPEILTQYDRCGTIMDFIVSLFTNRHGFALVLKH